MVKMRNQENGRAGRLVRQLEALVPDPARGLPEEVFLFISRMTPLVNVDLLIEDDADRVLLTWRDDGYSPPGWHLPGGIIRFKERAEARIRAVARLELNVDVDFDPAPLAVHELIDNRPTFRERGHFISFLHRCRLLGPLNAERRFCPGHPSRNAWMWHESYPESMIPVHGIYRSFFKS